MADIEVRQMGKSGRLFFSVHNAESAEKAAMEFTTKTGISVSQVYKDKRTQKEYWVDQIEIQSASKAEIPTDWRVIVWLTEVSAPGDFDQTPFPDE